MRVVGIGGEPATGKSSVMWTILKTLSKEEKPRLFKCGMVRGMYFEVQKILVVGIYEDGQKFAGTDRLSMAVQPEFLKMLHVEQLPFDKILLEGDRLFTGSAIREVGERGKWFILRASPDELFRRHLERHDTQTEKFLAGRATKYMNILAEFPAVKILNNNTRAEQEFNAKLILMELNG